MAGEGVLSGSGEDGHFSLKKMSKGCGDGVDEPPKMRNPYSLVARCSDRGGGPPRSEPAWRTSAGTASGTPPWPSPSSEGPRQGDPGAHGPLEHRRHLDGYGRLLPSIEERIAAGVDEAYRAAISSGR